MLIHYFPFLIFLFGFALEIFKEVCLFLGAVEKTELLVDDSQFTGGTDAASFEHDFLVVVKLELVLRVAEEVQAQEFSARHLLDVRIPYRRVEVEVERQFAATQFLLTESHFGDGC